MKLLRLNAVLIITILGIFVRNSIQTELKTDEALMKFDEMYSENDKYIDNIEKEKTKNHNDNYIFNKKKESNLEYDSEKIDENEDNKSLEINFLQKAKSNSDLPVSKKPLNTAKNHKININTQRLSPKRNAPNHTLSKPNKTNKSSKRGIIFKNFANGYSNSNKPTKIKIVMEKNPTLLENPNQLQKYMTYSKCTHKTGFLGLVKKVTPNEQYPSVIIATPIFVTLNTHTISFFSSTNTLSMFNNIKLERILRLTQRFTNTYCFDIVENEISNSSTSILKGPVSLCSSSLEDMKKWIDAIEEFKECQITVNPLLNNKRVLADFQKINTLLGNQPPSVPNAKTKDLYYDNTQKAYNPSPKRVANEIKIKTELKNINEIIKLGNMAQNKVRRNLVNKLKQAEQFALDVRKKQEIIQEIIRKRMQQEKMKETRLITIEHKAKEFQLLKAVEERIKKMKLQQLQDYKVVIDTRISETKSKANDEAKYMMRTLMNQNKNTDYTACTVVNLREFKDTKYVSNLCFQYFGESGQKICEEKREFCNQCCSHHIGIKYASELYRCKSKCTRVINGLPLIESNMKTLILTKKDQKNDDDYGFLKLSNLGNSKNSKGAFKK